MVNMVFLRWWSIGKESIITFKWLFLIYCPHYTLIYSINYLDSFFFCCCCCPFLKEGDKIYMLRQKLMDLWLILWPMKPSTSLVDKVICVETFCKLLRPLRNNHFYLIKILWADDCFVELFSILLLFVKYCF